jgi:hypothetical protein
MSDPEGALPSSGAYSLQEGREMELAESPADISASRLPTAAYLRSEGELLPPAGQECAVAEDFATTAPETWPELVPEPQRLSAPSTLKERLAAATLAGGLVELPANFGDPAGDWATVQSENPFEALYLDYRNADKVTPEIVGRHREILHKFWQEKLKSMSQGTARLTILAKYGGRDESDRLVRGYPGRIDRAYDRLSTVAGIEETCRELVAQEQKAFLGRVEGRLADFLVDSVLQPREILALFEFADREGVPRTVVADHVQDRICSAGLVSEDEIVGETLEQRLLSSSWVPPSMKSSVPTAVSPQPRNRMIPLLLFSVVVVLVLVIYAAFFAHRMIDPLEDRSVISVAPETPRPPAPGEASSVKPAVSMSPAAPELPIRKERTPPSAPVVTSKAPLPVPSANPIEPVPPVVVVSAEERGKVRDQLEDIRSLGATDPQTALDRAGQLDSKLAEEPQEFAAERVDLANLKNQILLNESRRVKADSEIQAQLEREKEWERRLAQIEALSKQGNFSGAKLLADQFLGEQGLPDAVALRAKNLADDALAKLQASLSGVKVKAKTVRSAERPPQ